MDKLEHLIDMQIHKKEIKLRLLLTNGGRGDDGPAENKEDSRSCRAGP